MRLTTLFSLLLLTIQTNANEIKSYYRAFADANEKNKIELSNKIMQAVADVGIIDSAYVYDDKTDKNLVYGNTLYLMGEYYYDGGDYRNSITLGLDALPYLILYGDKDILSDCYNLLGISYQRCGDVGKSILYMEKCYQIDQECNDNEKLSISLNNLAGIYNATNIAEVSKDDRLNAITI